MPKVARGSLQDELIEHINNDGPISHEELYFRFPLVNCTTFETAVDALVRKCIIGVDRNGRYFVR